MKTMKFVIREARKEDGEQMAKIFNEHTAEEEGGGFSAFSERPVPPDIFFETVVGGIAGCGYPCVVCCLEEGTTVVGFANSRPHGPGTIFARVCEVSTFVSKEWIRRGIGTMMLSELERRLREERGIVHILAAIAAPNERSIGFHTARGFERVGCFKGIGMISSGITFDVLWFQKMIS